MAGDEPTRRASRAKAAPCSSACRTSRAVRPRPRSTRRRPARHSAASRSTSRASSTARTISRFRAGGAARRRVATVRRSRRFSASFEQAAVWHGHGDAQPFPAILRPLHWLALPRLRPACRRRPRSPSRRLSAVSPMRETPSAALARNVRLLAASPRSFEALIGAGRAALALGRYPGCGRLLRPRRGGLSAQPAPKAGTGAALVAMEEPVQALGYFAEAQRLGASQVEHRRRPRPRL